MDPGEELKAALHRELMEEIGIETEIGAQIHSIVHAYPDRDVRLFFFDARIIRGEPQSLGSSRFPLGDAGRVDELSIPRSGPAAAEPTASRVAVDLRATAQFEAAVW